MTATIQFQFGSQDFTDECVDWRESVPKRLTPVTTPRADGATVSEEPTYEPRDVQVTIEVFGGTVEEARANLDAIIGNFPAGRSKLRKHSDRYLNAYFAGITSLQFIPGAAGNVIRADLRFFCDDPYYYSDAGAASTSDPSMAQSDTLVVTNSGGNILYPKLTIVPSGATMTSLKITNTSLSPNRAVDFNDSVAVGSTLEIDTSARTVTVDGSNALSGWHTPLWTASDWIWLNPGSNTLELTTLSGATSISLTVSHTDRWI